MRLVAKVDVARVKQLLAQGLTQTQVVQRLGYSKCTVSMIANGKYTQEAR
jgi:transcriptional regulator with XRE-family HTH domain